MIKRMFSEINVFFLICITSIMILLFNFFGAFGLVLYGVLITYSAIFFICNLKTKPILKTPIFYIMVAYYIYYLVAVCVNGSLPQLGSALLQLFLLSLTGFFIRDTNEIKSNLLSLSKIMTILGIFMALGSLSLALLVSIYPNMIETFPEFLKEFFNRVSFSYSGERLIGFGNQPNVTAEFCLICSLFSTYLISEINYSKKWICLSLLNIFSSFYIIFIATSSRTKMVSFLSFYFAYFIVYFFILHRNEKKLLKIASLILISFILIFILLGIFVFSSDNLRAFFLDKVIRISSISTASGRDSVYITAFNLGKGHRLFGYDVKKLQEAIAPHAHNIYLQLLSFAGIPGLILFCIYFFHTAFISGKNVISKNTEERKLNCFILCFIFCYFIQGLPEIAGVDHMRLSSVSAQLIFASVHIIHYNQKLQMNLDKANQ